MVDFLKKKKSILYVVVVLLCMIWLTNIVFLALRPKTEDGIKQSAYMYVQPRNTIDVVFMGTSHVHCDVNTKLLWDNYGIAAYDYSAAEQPLWITYYYIKEICKYQNPKLIVLDMFGPARFRDDYQYRWLSDNLSGIRPSLNKLNMAINACEKERLSEYIPSIASFHTRYDELGMDDVRELLRTNNARKAYKGYAPYYRQVPMEKQELSAVPAKALTPKSEEYLRKIIEYTEAEGISLYLMVAPYTTPLEDEPYYARISEIASEYGVLFKDANYLYNEIGIDFDTDFCDYSHLNFDGGCKFTSFLADEIKSNYDIPDRRGGKRWESWDRQNYNEEVVRYE